MGARIAGQGTDTIAIEGVRELHGVEYEIIADRIGDRHSFCWPAR